MMDEFIVRTRARLDMVNITPEIRNLVKRSGIKEGLCTIFVPHTTAGVTINENADPNVQKDIIKGMARLVPVDMGFKHAEGNSDGHIKSSLFGPSLPLIVSKADLLLGTWQGIFLCEFDGPRERMCIIKIIEG